MDVSLVTSDFVPTSSFTGGESPTILRGKNVIIRGQRGRAKLENYPGSKDLSEDYNINAETLTGTLTWAADSHAVSGSGTLFTTETAVGDTLLVGTEPCVVREITSDTSLTADRPGQLGQSGVTARYMFRMFEIGKKRGVLRRGNAIEVERKDIILAGGGTLFLNGTTTSITATKRPKRLQRAAAGTYTEKVMGFDAIPPLPVITATTGGWKGMLAGKYSFMLSYWNSVTDGYSNPCGPIKKDGGGTALTIAAGGRFEFDFTTALVNMPSNADGFVIWGTPSGGGVTSVNESLYAAGAWQRVKKIRTTAYSIGDADVDPSTDQVTIAGHKFRTGDSIYVGTTFGGLTAGTEYFAIVVDANTVKFATTAANANAGTAIDITGDPGGTVSVRALKVSDDKTFIEYLDGEMGGVASGTNDAPQDCSFVTEFANQVFFISALGKVTATNAIGTSPGNYVLPEKAGNHEAVNLDWKVSVGEEITGFANGVGRLFCLTANGIPFVTPTGRTELARLSGSGTLDMPFTSRPFWTKGGIAPNNLIVIQGDVFLYTGRTVLRSPSNADENTVPFEIGLPVADLTASWYQGHVFLGHCGKNQQLCLISSATHRNNAGYWVSQILPLNLQTNQWQPIIEVSSDTRDMIVSGVATVNGRMEFLAGGARFGTTPSIGTFRYDEAAGVAVPWYVVFQPSDLGEEALQKFIRSFRVTARTSAAIIQVHGARAGEDVSITDLEDGTNSISGNISVTAASGIVRARMIKQLVSRLQLFTIRYADEWPGTGSVNRLDELVLDVDFHGGRQ